MGDCAQYKTKNLILLMGTNPLPNYLAARMLGGADTRLHLVVTPEIMQKRLHERLLQALGGDPKDQSQFILLNSTKPDHIFEKIYTRISNTPGTWGLNYTGGKKVMVIQAFRAMEQALAKNRIPGRIYSYIDADTNALVIDPDGSVPRAGDSIPIEENVSLRQLLLLHGQPDDVLKKVDWEKCATDQERLGTKPRRIPFQPEFCAAFLSAWLDQRGTMASWRTCDLGVSPGRLCREIGLHSERAQELARSGVILGIGHDPSGKAMSGNQVTKEQKRLEQEFWASLAFPEIVQHKTGLHGLSSFSDKSGESVQALGNWLEGCWLEDYVLAQIIDIAQECGIHDYALGLESRLFDLESETTFESDVIFMRGHQLFYLSVTTDMTKRLNKSKSFEAYHRAQQLGGEHARTGLVTLFDRPQELAKELADQRSVDVHAFGPDDLKTSQIFRSELKAWMDGTRKQG